jgi:predicted RNA-binding protein with PIN domain
MKYIEKGVRWLLRINITACYVATKDRRNFLVVIVALGAEFPTRELLSMEQECKTL